MEERRFGVLYQSTILEDSQTGYSSTPKMMLWVFQDSNRLFTGLESYGQSISRNMARSSSQWARRVSCIIPTLRRSITIRLLVVVSLAIIQIVLSRVSTCISMVQLLPDIFTTYKNKYKNKNHKKRYIKSIFRL